MACTVCKSDREPRDIGNGRVMCVLCGKESGPVEPPEPCAYRLKDGSSIYACGTCGATTTPEEVERFPCLHSCANSCGAVHPLSADVCCDQIKGHASPHSGSSDGWLAQAWWFDDSNIRRLEDIVGASPGARYKAPTAEQREALLEWARKTRGTP